MNGRITRTALDADADQTCTDWERLAHLSDADIDRAIASDPDAYAVAAADEIGRTGASYRYRILRAGDAGWRWQLLDAGGQVLADSHRSFASRRQAEHALRLLRQALLGAAAA